MSATRVELPPTFFHPIHDRPKRILTPGDKATITTNCASDAFILTTTCRATDQCIPFNQNFVDDLAKFITIQPDFNKKYVIIREKFMAFFEGTPECKLFKTAFGPDTDLSNGFESRINDEFKCPVTFKPFSESDAEPVMAADGHFYSKAAIKHVMDDAGNNYDPIARSPLTNEPLANHDLTPLDSLRRKTAYMHDDELKRARAFFAILLPSVFKKFVAKATEDEDTKRAAEHGSKLTEFDKNLKVQYECLETMYPVPPTPEHLYNPFGGNAPQHPSKPAQSLVAAVRGGLHTYTHPEGPWQVPGVGPTSSIIAQVHRLMVPGIPQHTLVEYMSDAHHKKWVDFRKRLKIFRTKMIEAGNWTKPQTKPPQNVD